MGGHWRSGLIPSLAGRSQAFWCSHRPRRVDVGSAGRPWTRWVKARLAAVSTRSGPRPGDFRGNGIHGIGRRWRIAMRDGRRAAGREGPLRLCPLDRAVRTRGPAQGSRNSRLDGDRSAIIGRGACARTTREAARDRAPGRAGKRILAAVGGSCGCDGIGPPTLTGRAVRRPLSGGRKRVYARVTDWGSHQAKHRGRGC